jgi:mono/diheme cytochrome c family protein
MLRRESTSSKSLVRGLRAATLILAGVVQWGVPEIAGAQEGSLITTRDGVFSDDQARSGQETFETVCAACHVPEHFGDGFIRGWAGATVGDLFDLVSQLMPEDQPGSLKPEEYVAVLSYIFKMNGLPPGPEALAEHREILGGIRIEK